MRKVVLVLSIAISIPAVFGQNVTIPIVTDNTAMVLQTDSQNQLRTVSFGQPRNDDAEFSLFTVGIISSTRMQELPIRFIHLRGHGIFRNRLVLEIKEVG